MHSNKKMQHQIGVDEFLLTSSETDIEKFLLNVFPQNWSGIAARIIESGATFSHTKCPWAPRLSQIPATKKQGLYDSESRLKTIIYKVHDCIHQLWGLPNPGNKSIEEKYYYKRSQMCGEVAVLTLAEFVYAKWIYDAFPTLRGMIEKRNAVPMLSTHLNGKSTQQIAMRLDDLLHKKSRPLWVREDKIATAFVDDYVPMLEKDRELIDLCWASMNSEYIESLQNAPSATFSNELDGLELTLWMISDFEHMMTSTPKIDHALKRFNTQRRSEIKFPNDWPV